MANNHDFARVRALFFDLDGTLIDSKLDLALAVNAALAAMGRATLDTDRIGSFIGDGAPALIRKTLAASSGAVPPEEEVARALEFFLGHYRAHMLDNTVLYPGVRECLDELAASSAALGLAVLTNKPVRISREILAGLGVVHHFRFVYGGNSLERKKPDPMGVDALLKDFGIGPREAMMVGDSEIDVQTARNAGILVCGVTYGLGSHRLRDHPPDLLLDSLAALPGILNGR